ncbi:hypothetical protein GOP47_0017401 [Adiantum capillus-veneris]|uniref:RING-CH-type domain-containing protein n=1 Tax=Adiantum capillus-veneris TaxID=13818 RepID=A0A9D4UG54_ADICA|nr:hypothetical protein GOP47_0017401 [Adiantum capillus-veneris]
MSEHVALFVDRIVASTAGNGDSPFPIAVGRASLAAKKAPFSLSKQLSLQKSSCSTHDKDEDELHRAGSKNSERISNEKVSEPLLAETAAGECRICQEEDEVLNLEAPCACTGSLKFAHRKCVQHWCNEKGDTVCEICCKPYEGGYTVPSSSARADSLSINIRSWEVGGEQLLNSQRSRLFSVASEHVFLESDYEEYTRANARSAACFRSVAFILMVLLLLRHLLSMTSTVAGEDASTFILLFFLRAVGFFLPCYIMARALNVLHCRRQREEAALAAAEVAYLLQNGQSHIVPGAAASAE